MPPDPSNGHVMLVGAGPGPADLLTLRAAEAIKGAQALLYDALVSEEAIALAPDKCLKVQTGKRAGRASMRQETINRLMVRLARRGLRVVRLKGGDPSVFGRVGEEMEVLRLNAVTFEVVPGVTAACAAAAQFQFPLTHRRRARRVVFMTAKIENGELTGDWRAAADAETTAAIYMGGADLETIAAHLLRAGRAPNTPVLVIQNAGGLNAQLSAQTLLSACQSEPLVGDGPFLIVVGEVGSSADAGVDCDQSDRHALRG